MHIATHSPLNQPNTFCRRRGRFAQNINLDHSLWSSSSHCQWIKPVKKVLSVLAVLMLMGAGNSLQANPIQEENEKRGDSGWNAFPIAVNSEIEGYASKVSARGGENINFFVNVRDPKVDPNYTLTIYRLGWYHGAGARRMMDPISRRSVKQIIPKPDAFGMISANWTSPVSLAVSGHWPSGVYIATVVGEKTGIGRYIPFVVVKDSTYSDYLIQTSATTWQAYNLWGGKSLYAVSSTDNIPARKVSFNRPYLAGAGMGDFNEWEINLLRFMEKEGYDVTYQTDIDTHNDKSGYNILFHRAVLSVGHDEYWTYNMRHNFENARDHGISLGFFGANPAFWQVRMEDDNRTMVAFKDFVATEDPYALDNDPRNDKFVTAKWRDAELNRPENALVGIMYLTDPVNTDIVVSNATHWIYTSTGLKNGDTLTGLLGYEIDAVEGYDRDPFFNNSQAPENLQLVAHSPASPGAQYYGDMTVYTKNCRAWPCLNRESTIFAAGSMQWNWGLDHYGHSPNLENCYAKQITRNILARFIGSPLPVQPRCDGSTAGQDNTPSDYGRYGECGDGEGEHSVSSNRRSCLPESEEDEDDD